MKVQFVPAHARKAHGGSRTATPPVLNMDTRCRLGGWVGETQPARWAWFGWQTNNTSEVPSCRSCTAARTCNVYFMPVSTIYILFNFNRMANKILQALKRSSRCGSKPIKHRTLPISNAGSQSCAFSDFNQTNFLSRFSKKRQYEISQQSAQWEPTCSFRTDGWTDMTKLLFAFHHYGENVHYSIFQFQ